MKADTFERLGPFRLLEELGSGAMGTVYLAEDTDEDRTVALKVLHPHLLSHKGFFQRFQREALAGQQVRHPNVVQTLDCSFHVAEEDPYCVLVMEYVRGRTLRDLQNDLGTVPESLVREIGRQVAEGLVAIHEAGLVHRDLKPENVLITDDHRVRIMDLGVARHTELSTALTKDGQFAGSLLYAAPEQFRVGARVEARADLYALGVVLYELISGVNPFRHDEPGAVMHAHLEFVAERLDRRMEDASPFLSELVATLLEKDPDARFESASALGGVFRDGESSLWWGDRKRAVHEGRERRVRVPVRRETALHGREADLALLGRAWEEAAQGEGRAVLIEGEAGIGKSRLVDAFLAEVDGRHATVLYGSYPPTGGMGGISDALLAHFEQADLEKSLRPYLGVTPLLVPALAALLKHDSPPEGSPSLQGDPLHAVFVHLMRGLAEESPLVWVIEDLHFADADSRKLILSLARAVEGHRVLLLLTTRPELPEEELAHLGRLENLVRTGLARLGAREVISLLQDAFRSQALAEKLGGKIAFKSDGVPFFVFEMIRGLREGQFITQLPDGSWIESKIIDDIEVPSAVRDLIGIRLKGLTKEERAILDVGAVQGFEFDPDLIARVLRRPRVSVLQDAADIERRSGVLRAQGRRVRFDHHLIQEVLYEDMIPALREEYHSLLARAFAERENASAQDAAEIPGNAAIFLAEHGLRGRAPRDGLAYLDHALDHLEQIHALEKAVTLCGTALSVPRLLEGEACLEMLFRKCDWLDFLGRRFEQESVLDEIQALGEVARRKPHLRSIEQARGNLSWRLGRYEDARERFERALVIARELGDRLGAAASTDSLGNVFAYIGRYEEARECYERSLAITREVGDRRNEGVSTTNLGDLFRKIGRNDDAREHYERSLAIARATEDRRGEAMSTAGLGTLFARLGQYKDAREHHERALAINREIGNRRGEAGGTLSLGNVHLSVGQYEDAREHYERALAIDREIGNRRGECQALGSLALVLGAARRSAEALARYEQCLNVDREIGNRESEAITLVNLGALWLTLGERSRGVEALEGAARMCRELGQPRPLGYALWSLGRAAAESGDASRARDLMQQSIRLRREIGHSEGLAESLLGLGEIELRAGEVDAAGTALREAAGAFGAQGRGSPLAYTLACLACLPGGDIEAAERKFRDAGERADSLETRYMLWKATGKHEHLQEAKRLLDYLVEHAPVEYRESMLKNVRLNREIMEAWAEHGGGAEEENKDC